MFKDLDPDNKAALYGRIAKYVGLGLVGLCLFFLMATLALGIVVGCSLIAAAVVAVNFLPVVELKVKNRALKALKTEAQKNPIETAQNQLIELNKELDAFKQETADRMAQGNAMIEDVRDLAKTDPEGAAAFEPDIVNFYTEMAHREQQLTEMITSLDDATTRVNRADKRWKLAQKHAGVRKPSEAAKALSKIVLDEAFDTVLVAAHKNAANMTVENMALKVRQDIQQQKAGTAPAVVPLSLENLKPFTLGNNLLAPAPKAIEVTVLKVGDERYT